MSDPFVPQDQDVRRRIRESLDENLFVVAGAGTGKTNLTGNVRSVFYRKIFLFQFFFVFFAIFPESFYCRFYQPDSSIVSAFFYIAN